MAFMNAEDRRVYVLDFGVQAFATPAKGGDRREILGIYDENHASFNPNRWPGSDYQMQSGAGFSSTGASLECCSIDIVGIKQGARIEVPPCDELPGGGDFKVQDVRPDGSGMTILMLIERDPE